MLSLTQEKYTLDIVSHHPEFDGKRLKKFHVGGIDTIGAYGSENFSVVFKNNTSAKVQTVISIDGTCVSTGKLASTEPNSEGMWVVEPYSTLTLKAWKESDQGGAAFVFTHANNSVAVHTHGDMSSQGIIAAAIFVEGQPVKQPVNQTATICTLPIYTRPPKWWLGDVFPYHGVLGPYWHYNTTGTKVINTDVYCSSTATCVNNVHMDVKTAAVGAGAYTEQKVTYQPGLIKPLLSEVVRVKYMWWDELVSKLRTEDVSTAQPQASGFPADGVKKGVNLSGVPRVGEEKRSVPMALDHVQRHFSRV